LLPRFEGYLVDPMLPLMPAMRGVSCEVAATVANQGWSATNWTLYSHAGTHMASMQVTEAHCMTWAGEVGKYCSR
jgi:hypothetical protein